MRKIDFSNKFKKAKKDMNISKNDKDILMEHPNVLNYLSRYESIKNGQIILDGTLLNVISNISTGENKTFIDKETNQHMVLYMKQQFVNEESEIYNKESNYRFHIVFCETIEEHIKKGGHQRYIAVKSKDNNFKIVNIVLGQSKNTHTNITTIKKMYVCRNCLSKINYKNYNLVSKKEQDKIVENFSLQEFYEEYEQKIMYIPMSLMDDYNKFKNDLSLTYTEDWNTISRNFREYKNWTCELCGKNMRNNRRNLHVHHKDHNKRNNNFSNLLCICRNCHSKMPGHGYMK